MITSFSRNNDASILVEEEAEEEEEAVVVGSIDVPHEALGRNILCILVKFAWWSRKMWRRKRRMRRRRW